MDSWEFNKIAAAVLTALLVVFGGREIVHVSQGKHGKDGAEIGYKLPVEVADASKQAGAGEAKKEGVDFVKIAGLMQTASVDAGASGFKKCSTCHTPNKGGKNGTGPNLWNIVNQEIGKVDDFKYSKAMASKEGAWDYEALANFLHKPKKWLKGTKMAFGGIRNDQDIADMLVYLRSLSDTPSDLPAAVEKASADQNE